MHLFRFLFFIKWTKTYSQAAVVPSLFQQRNLSWKLWSFPSISSPYISLSLSTHTHTECMPFPCNLSHYRFPFIPSCAVFSTYSCFFFPKLLFFFITLISYSQLCRICLFLWGSGTKCGSASNNLFAPSSPSSLEGLLPSCQMGKRS